MDILSSLNRWGAGQLLGFSAFDGKTDFYEGLVLRSVAASSALEIKLPVAGGVLVFDLAAPKRCMLAGDHFVVETASGVTRGAFVDACHLLIEGPCRALGLSSKVRAAEGEGKLLLGSRNNFREELLHESFDAVFAARRRWFESLPVPAGLPEASRLTLAKACSQIKTQLNSAEGLIKRRWTTPDRWPHRRMWLWDSVFHAAGLRHLDLAAAKETLDAVFDSQDAATGFIPHAASPDKVSEITQPPILGFGIELLLEDAPDDVWLRSLYPKNAAYLKWVMANRDSDGAGLVEWFIEAIETCRSGESGMDNSSRFDGAIQLDAPDFNAFLAQDCEIMAGFAARLGLPEDERFWRGEHARLNRLMNERLWDPAKGLYFDYDVKGDIRSDIECSAGFLPLLSGAPTPEMAAKLVAALKDPTRFGTALPVPSIGRASQAVYSKDMWRGPTWININWLIVRGLRRYGFMAEAQALYDATRGILEKNYLDFGTFFEFYDDRGEVTPPELLRKAKCDPLDSPYHQAFMDYGWSGTLYIDMVFRS